MHSLGKSMHVSGIIRLVLELKQQCVAILQFLIDLPGRLEIG